jgi:hypothetical protein
MRSAATPFSRIPPSKGSLVSATTILQKTYTPIQHEPGDVLQGLTRHTGWCSSVGTETKSPQTKGARIYVRRIKSRKYGDYFQLVRSYREEGTGKKDVPVHLGEYETPEEALAAWSNKIAEHQSYGRDEQAMKLQHKLDRLQELMVGA